MFRKESLAWLLTVCFCFLPSCPAKSQTSDATADERIIQEIREHNQLADNLEYLSDMIGPRITGSTQLNNAANWAVALCRKYGLENVHLEGWKIAHSWQRGSARARIVSPVVRNLTIASSAWSPETSGPVRGKVVYVSANNTDELQSYKGKLKDTIVIYQEPPKLLPQPFIVGSANPAVQMPAPVPDRSSPSPEALFNSARMKVFKDEGVLAALRDSNKLYGLLTMTSVGGSKFDIGAVPTAMLTHEDYSLIWRLLKRGAINIEIDISNSFSDGPMEVYNTIAEIRGVEKPDEVVMICAHLDAWDLGSGSTADGTGVVSVIEALRALKALGLHPRRTIRLVLFAGEEQGDVGSREYVKRHEAELSKISAVLEDDTGTPPILTIDIHQNYAARKMVDTTLAPLRALKLIEPRMERRYGSDYASFNEVGVPGFSCIGDESDYNQTHHTQADTFDKVRIEGIIQSAQLLACWAYNTAELPGLLPRE